MKFRRIALILPFLLVLTVAGIAPSEAASTTNAGPLGVFRGSGRADLVGDYQSWLGRNVGYAVDFTGRTATTDTAPWKKIDDPKWVCQQWAGKSWNLVLSTAMLPNSNFTLAAGARGDYDAHWLSFAKTMVASGCGNAVIRLGWEFNGKFYPWAAGGKEADFAAYWRRIVTVMRSVSGQSFRFDWCPLAGNVNANVAAAWPGDAYVDIVGLDAYDTSAVHTSDADRWNDQVNRPYGLKWQRDFAAAHGKGISFPEWGLTVRPNDSLGGGDNPYYIAQMYRWVTESNAIYAGYFEYDAADSSHRLMTTQFPNAAAEFRKVATTAPPSTTTTTAPPATTTTTAPPATTTTTAPPSTTSVSIWSRDAAPKSIASDTRPVEVGLKFRSDVAGTVTGIRFYKDARNTGAHVGSLWSSSGNLLARANFSSESASGWQQVTFASPVRIKAQTTYVVSYHMNGGRYAEDTGVFSNAGVDNPPLHALKKGVSGGNGTFSYSSTPTFPAKAAAKSTNYWVDLAFTPGA